MLYLRDPDLQVLRTSNEILLAIVHISRYVGLQHALDQGSRDLVRRIQVESGVAPCTMRGNDVGLWSDEWRTMVNWVVVSGIDSTTPTRDKQQRL
jgi:hypothetical protein